MKKLAGLALGALVVHLILKEQRKKAPRLFIVDRVPLGFNAATIPPFGVYVRKEQASNAPLLQHELIHWKQYQRMGLLPFYLNYLVYAATEGYDKNPMEVEAREIEDDYCKLNYTECVRNGTAKTAFNPNFRL